jgi:hypothetical protein
VGERLVITAVEFRLYTSLAATDYRLLMDFVSASVDVKYNDIGAFQMVYPLDSDPVTQVKGAKELVLDDQSFVGAVVIFDDGSSVEFERYIIDSTSDTVVADGARVRNLAGRSSLAVLEDAVVYPSNWPVTAPSGHQFVDSTAGTIFRTLILRARTRGCFPNLWEGSFSGIVDSTGSPWALTMGDQDYANGTTYLQILQDFMSRGLVDSRMDAWTFVLQNGGSMGRHIPIGTLEVRPATNVTEMTRTTDSTESVSTVLIGGEEGTAVERHNSGSQALLGRRRERFVSQGGIADSGTLTILADAELELHGKIPSEETVGVIPGGGLTPFRDFEASDWVYVRFEGSEAPVERRVRQIGLTVDADRNLAVGLTLNSIIFENEVKLQRKIDGYAGSGGSYGPTPVEVDNTTPNAPSSLHVQSSTFVSTQGTYVAAVSASWAAPTTNVGGSPLTDLSGYELTWKYSSESVWSFVHASDDTVHQWSPVAPGSEINVRVRSVDNSNHRSAWSVTINHTVAVDTENPPQPSQPLVSPRFAAVLVRWDGFGDDAGTEVPMPLDLNRVEIWKSLVSGFEPEDGSSQMVGSLGYGGGDFEVSGSFDVPVFVRLVAVDNAGNRSVASEQATAIPSRVTTPDVDPDTIFTDGLPPDSSPIPTVIGGLGILSVRWDGIANHDPVYYDVHISSAANFVPSADTLCLTTPATMATIRALPGPEPFPGEVDTRNLQYGVDYFIKIVAFDADGAAVPSDQDSGQMFQVNTPDIASRSIVTEHLQAQAVTAELLAGELVLGSVIKTAVTGQRTEQDVLGLRLYGPANEILVNLPTTPGQGPFLSGDAVMGAVTTTDGFTMRSTKNEIPADSGLTMAASQTPPINPPQLSIDYDKIRPDYSIQRTGALGTFGLNPNEVSFVVYNAPVLRIFQIKTTGTRCWFFDLAGVPVAPFFTDHPGNDIRGYVETSGFQITLLRDMTASFDSWFVYRFSGTSGIYNRYTRLNPGSAPTLGTTGSVNYVAETHPTLEQVYVRNLGFSSTNFAQIPITSTVVSSSSRPLGGTLDAVLYGNFDFGSPRYVISHHGSNFNFRTMNAGGVWQNSEDWESPTESRRGLIWDGTQFWTYSADGYLYKHTTYKWTSESSVWWAGYTWYDSDPVGGLHETTLGPLRSITMKKRAKLRITLPVVPDNGSSNSPDQWRVYLTRGASEPLPSTTFFQVAGSTPTTQVVTPLFSGAAPPLISNFPNAIAGWFKSAQLNGSGLAQFEVDGLATGRWASLEFLVTGKAQTTYRLYQKSYEGWTNLTLQNSWVTFDANYPPPGFRLDPDGYVTLRGCVKNGTAFNAVIATLPSLTPSVRPPQRWSPFAICNHRPCRLVIEPAGTLAVSGTDAGLSNAFVDLSGIRFATF